MLRAIKKLIILVGVFALFSIVFCLILFFGNKIVEGDNNVIVNGISAFMGAFFAFLFTALGKLFAEVYLRRKKHWTTLVEAEGVLNGYISINSDNIYLIKLFKKAVNNSAGFLNNNFTRMEIRDDLLLSLYNIDLINELSFLNIGIRKANADMEFMLTRYNDWYDQGRKNYLIDQSINETQFKGVKEEIINKLSTVHNFLITLDDEIITSLAKIRLLTRELPVSLWLIKVTSFKEHYPKNLKIQVSKEIQKIREEIERNKVSSS